MNKQYNIQPIDPENREKVNRFIQKRWFSTDMLIRGEVVDLTKADGFVLFDASEIIIGLVTYIFRKEFCEITSLDVTAENRGIGTALIQQVAAAAKTAEYHKIRVITTNDNLHAFGFYQKRGFDLFSIHRNAVDHERAQKPDIPMIGNYGIPLKHEIEFEMDI